MGTIPANLFVNVVPSVLAAGGSALDLNGLVLTNSKQIPIGSVLSFPNAAAVAAYFGPSSAEAKIAGGGTSNAGNSLGGGYFGGYTGATKTPDAILFAQYPSASVSAFTRGGNAGALGLTAVKAITGTLSIVVDGNTFAAGSINLSSAGSFSAAATLLQTALNTSVPNAATVTGSITTTVLTVTAVASGTLIPGQTVAGGTTAANTKISNQLTSTETDGHFGGKGTYTVSISQTVTSGTLTTTAPLVVSYDSVSGGFVITDPTSGAFSTIAFATGTAAAPLLLTQATGAVISQGAAPATPSAFMGAITNQIQNWATFMTAFDPDGGSGNAQKLAFANWVNGQNNRYAYVCWDTDITPTESVPATGSLGYLLQQEAASGTCLIYEPVDYNYAAFVCGFAASLDFLRTNGRTTLAYRGQAGLVPSVTDATTAVNLGGSPQSIGDYGNGYNYYAAIATAHQTFINMQRGSITGPFQWFDSYVNQIWLNNAFQQALMELLVSVGSIPYNQAGNALIEAALADPINAGLNFGAFRAGITLSAAQVAEVNAAAGGINIATTLQNRGWYLQIGIATAQVRQSRGTPPMTFWYCDGQSVQSFNLASILVQ